MFNKASFDTCHENFLSLLMQRGDVSDLYLWDAQAQFLANWDIERLDFDVMYDESLQSNISQRIWTGVDYHPKESMKILLRHEKEFIRSMFRDLFNEAKDLHMRISRFIFHCDELMRTLQKKEAKLIHHYHDEAMVMSYLALYDPSRYTFLDMPAFRKTMETMDALNIPDYISLESYTKLMRIIQKFLMKDLSLINGYRTLFDDLSLYRSDSLLLALDFVRSISKKY